MKTGLDNIFKGTATEKAIGHIKVDDLAPTKFKVDTEPRPNFYEEFQLTDEKTNLIKKILAVTGFATKKDAKKAGKSSDSPAKSTQKGKASSATKSAGKKKAAASSKKNEEFEMILQTINEPIEFPIFRYIPDRATVQRLVHRVAGLKDEITSFDPVGKPNKQGNDLLELE